MCKSSEFSYIYKSPVGRIKFVINTEALVSLHFIDIIQTNKKNIHPKIANKTSSTSDKSTTAQKPPSIFQTRLSQQVYALLDKYFNQEKVNFNIPLAFTGTPFQEEVWTALQAVPWGETRTYKWIAEKIGRPQAVRAVGTAAGANPIPLIVPCHRIIGSNGKLTGYAYGTKIKAHFLECENAPFSKEV